MPPTDDVLDDDFVGPLPDDFVGPLPDDFVGPMPDDFVGPLPDDSNKNPTVTVNEVDVTEDPAPPTDAADDFEIDRELGIVQQSDVFVGPKTLNPVTPTTTTTTPSVTVNEVALTDTPAPPTDPADDFEIDRELGLVQQSDVFMGQPNNRLVSNVGNVTVADIEDFSDYADLLNTDIASNLPAATPASTNSISNVEFDPLALRTPEQEMQVGTLLEPSEWTLIEPDLSANLPAAVPEPKASNDLTDQDLMEMALFEMLTQELLTGRRPVVPKVTPRG